MGQSIKQLCFISILCGAALSLSPEGGVKKIMTVLCTALLMLSVIIPLHGMDFSSLALENARLREKEAELSLKGEDINRRLSRLVIEDEYEAYIMDKAAEVNAVCENVSIDMKWSSEGFWLPSAINITVKGGENEKSRLSQIIEAELGIAAENQYWS